MIQNRLPTTKVTFSPIIIRSDDHNLNAKGNSVNSFINTLAKKINCPFLDHSNIKPEHLNAGGLHLNIKGVKALAVNVKNHINTTIQNHR